jgi:hypothetical protein
MQDIGSQVPRIHLLGTSVNKRSHKLGTASRVGRRPVQVAVRLNWLLPCLPGDRRGYGGIRGNFGDRDVRLCLVHTAS